MKRLIAVDVALSVLVLALVTSTLAPAIGRVRRSTAEARCQSNLHRWAQALSLYVADNSGRYPTNRQRHGAAPGPINASVALSPQQDSPVTGKPWRFQYGINWVEALYDYIWESAEKTGQDWKSFRKCPNASTKTWPIPNPQGYPYPSVTYVFNCNLVECRSGLLRNPSKVLMLREFWLTTISELRPSNNSTGSSSIRPQYPFLNGDLRVISGNADTACKLHGDGSYIVFADGHVRFFTIDYYPKYADITAVRSWDGETQQWWNYGPGSGRSAPYLKSIAITP